MELNEVVNAESAKLTALIERACELMITSTDEVGVLVHHREDGSADVSLTTKYQPMVVTHTRDA
ncbi:hypothetical protein [Plantibacter sp. YIM 135249]|uniref:hypothetical protein n=1 Tax=Plantibacter sp. YIM 135249 TaxID=3423918 RepID=UPI003D34E55E